LLALAYLCDFCLITNSSFVGFLQEEVTALRAALAEAKHGMQLQSDVPLLRCPFDAAALPHLL
jgi:hypothetical protein